jgi:glyoxylase-like metal-dependent hydrolase (beta-lactamase superfamily II)
LVVETYASIGVTRLSRWIFNCYLIHDGGDGRSVVVDAGLPSIVDDLFVAMSRLGLPPENVGAVVATHGHSDHVGGAAALARRLRCRVHLPSRTGGYLAGEDPRTPGPRAIARIWPALLDQPLDFTGLRGLAAGAQIAGYSNGRMRWRGDPPTADLIDGGPLPGAPAWKVLATPGHTDDSVAFYAESTRTLLSGDSVLCARGMAWCTPETVDDDLARATNARLRALEVDHLLPGHGRPVSAPDLLATAIAPTDRPGRLPTPGH